MGWAVKGQAGEDSSWGPRSREGRATCQQPSLPLRPAVRDEDAALPAHQPGHTTRPDLPHRHSLSHPPPRLLPRPRTRQGDDGLAEAPRRRHRPLRHDILALVITA